MGIYSKGVVMVVVVVTCMVVLSMHVEVTEALTCGQVTGSLAPCLPYLRSTVSAPTSGCCSGVKKLNGLASSTPDRRQACTCLKTLAKGLKGINYAIANGLPGKCGVPLPYKINPSTDCSKVT